MKKFTAWVLSLLLVTAAGCAGVSDGDSVRMDSQWNESDFSLYDADGKKIATIIEDGDAISLSDFENASTSKGIQIGTQWETLWDVYGSFVETIYIEDIDEPVALDEVGTTSDAMSEMEFAVEGGREVSGQFAVVYHNGKWVPRIAIDMAELDKTIREYCFLFEIKDFIVSDIMIHYVVVKNPFHGYSDSGK